MLQYIQKPSEVQNSELVFLLENSQDLEKLQFLKLEKNILTKIRKLIKEKKNTSLSFFLGKKSFETLTVIFYLDTIKNKDQFLGEIFPKLSKKLTLLSNTEKNQETLLDYSLLTRYTFQKYLSKKEADEIFFLVENKDQQKMLETRQKTLENIILVRDLWETPSNDLYPENFANIIKKTKFKNTKVRVFTPSQVQKKGLNLLWAVGKGSAHKPHMVILERIVDKKLPTIGMVGKGITFDTGGIQVKPGNFMYDMKDDMCGAATAFAIMKELDEKDVPVNIVTAVCLAENHISGDAYKPSDIFTSYSGKTVDIGHTDAEWRLVMADGISYISKNYQLDKIITIATLTGICAYAFGTRYAAVMGTDRESMDKLIVGSRNTCEKYLEMPFDDYFVEKTKGKISDIQNITDGIKCGSTMAGAFLYNFRMNDELFLHLDIAGVANNFYEPYGRNPKGTTGFGVESLSELIMGM